MDKYNAIITVQEGRITEIEKEGGLRIRIAGTDSERIAALIIAIDAAERDKYVVGVKVHPLKNTEVVVCDVIQKIDTVLECVSVKEEHDTQIVFHVIRKDENEHEEVIPAARARN